MRPDADLNAMLEELAHAGIRPVLHQRTDPTSGSAIAGLWCCYSEGEVRHFHIGEGADPESAVRSLYVHTFRPASTPVAGPALTAEQALEAREARIRAATAMGYVVGGIA